MIKVIIERQVAEGLEPYYEAAIAQLLDVMASAPGYMAAESLVEIHRPNHYLVISRWTNEDAWNRWFHSADRQDLQGAIRPFLQDEEKFTLVRQLKYHRGAAPA